MIDRVPRLAWRAPLVLAMLSGAIPAGVGAQTLTLGAALDSALATHPSVGAAQARMEGATATHEAARAAYLPTVTGSAGITRFQQPMVVAPLHGFDPLHPPAFDQTLIQGQVGMAYTLFDGGARGALSSGTAAAEESMALQKDAIVQELIQSVTLAYTAVLGSREVFIAAEAQVDALASEFDRAGQRLREGTAARVEVLRAEAALLDARAQSASAEVQVGVAERNLARLMGVDPSTTLGRSLADVAPRRGARGVAVADNPRILAAARAVDAAQARVDQENAGRLPSVRAAAGLQNFGSSRGEYDTEWQAGLQVSWPLFTGGARTAAIHKARADLRVAEQQLAQARLAVAADLDGADAAWREASARAEALAASVAQWEEVARVEALSLENGAGLQQDYLRAQAALFQARAGLARARFDMILALVGRARAQGHLDLDWMATALETAR
ncbi:MAG TPA: TolC family protein [Longimicrobiales bacterium]|nr:TolC family protein [Longimicrobiales bacterium]